MPRYSNFDNEPFSRERTTVIAVLSGLGKAILPLMDFVGGQLYKYGGYYAVYGTSLTFTVVGVVYIILIPESVTRRSATDFDCP